MNELTALNEFDEYISEPQQLGIVVKSYTEIGSLTSLNNGKVTFTPTEIALIDEQRSAYHVKIELDRPNQHPQNAFAAIPYEEVDRVIAGARVLALKQIHDACRVQIDELSRIENLSGVEKWQWFRAEFEEFVSHLHPRVIGC